MNKRKKVFKAINEEQANAKFDEWESNYYESLKNSSGSEFDANEDELAASSKQKKKLRKMNKVNFKKKVLKSEKKSNLLKLNVNLKQMIFDEFKTDNKSQTTVFNNYIMASMHKTAKRPFKICVLCLKELYDVNCRLCRSSLCLRCIDIHPEINCKAFVK